MLGKAVWISTVVMGLFLTLGIIKLCVITESDISLYKAKLAQYQQMIAQSSSDSASQTREGVRKDIWFSQDNDLRLQYRIESDSSILTLVPEKGKLDIVENLSNIRCWMQEKLTQTPAGATQQLRYLQAAEGIYRLSKQNFFASSVTLSLFRLPGHELTTPTNTSQAFLKGQAEDISFSVSGKTPHFEARHFNASLKTENPSQ